MILDAIEEAAQAGARRSKASAVVGIDVRTLQRWRVRGGSGEDRRNGPRRAPDNKLPEPERRVILDLVNSPEYRDLSPHQIVPILADLGIYVASESTIFRLLREGNLLKHRETSRAPRKRHRPWELQATGPNQVWSWDITYLRSPIRGCFFYLYLVLDVWSRKIVAAEVHAAEDGQIASTLIEDACSREGIRRGQLTVHSDNGSPMKGATLLATLQQLGVATSFSRPSVSNDNPYSEALFRTLKYRPQFPNSAFASIDDARTWVAAFVCWYNTKHRHSAIRFVTPTERHAGEETAILEDRSKTYEAAKLRHPERWSGCTRNWQPIEVVYLNPKPDGLATGEVA